MLLRPAYREREIYSNGHGLGMRSQPYDCISVMRVKLQDVYFCNRRMSEESNGRVRFH